MDLQLEKADKREKKSCKKIEKLLILGALLIQPT